MNANLGAIQVAALKLSQISQLLAAQGIISPTFTKDMVASTQLPNEVKAQVAAIKAQQTVLETLIDLLA